MARILINNSFYLSQNNYSKTLSSFGQIADGAQIILDLCDPNSQLSSLSGQQFYDDGWNIVVKGTKC